MAARVATATRSDASTLEVSNEYTLEVQQLGLGCNAEDTDSLLLHLIRIIALYLFVFLSQTTKLVVTDAELAVFVSDAATSDMLDKQTKELQHRLDAALFAWVLNEVTNNQFDGLLHEQRAFVVIKRLFRQQRTKATARCHVLAALLTSYLTRLETPLVHCEPSSMLPSTLEYLLAKEKDAANKGPVPLPILYPLVNAVDLVSIEQRECLDALMNLFQWLSVHDQSQNVFTTFTSTYHRKFIGLRLDSDNSNLDNRDELGICFVQMLLRYSDHIFRRDLQFDDMVPTLSYSDTEDDDASSEDGNTRTHPAHDLNDSNLPADILEKHSNPTATIIPLNEEKENGELPAKLSSQSLRKRKNREDKTMEAPMKSARSCSKLSRLAEILDQQLLMDEELEQDDELPTVVCFGIAAAAGTLAAVLCVFFN